MKKKRLAERTEEEKAAARAKTDLVMQAISLIQAETKGRRGVQGKVKCPKCQGDLSYSVAAYNGHIWGRCATSDCLAWMM